MPVEGRFYYTQIDKGSNLLIYTKKKVLCRFLFQALGLPEPDSVLYGGGFSFFQLPPSSQIQRFVLLQLLGVLPQRGNLFLTTRP